MHTKSNPQNGEIAQVVVDGRVLLCVVVNAF